MPGVPAEVWEFEVTVHCSWGCGSCPVAAGHEPRRTMPMAPFQGAIDELAGADAAYATFPFFNESTRMSPR